MKSLVESINEGKYYTIEDRAVGAVYALFLKGIDGILVLIQKVVEKVEPNKRHDFLIKLRNDIDDGIQKEIDAIS